MRWHLYDGIGNGGRPPVNEPDPRELSRRPRYQPIPSFSYLSPDLLVIWPRDGIRHRGEFEQVRLPRMKAVSGR
jgi:hypothetical protein